jgi:hypothetical protein
MKRKLLLLIVLASIVSTLHAQKKQKPVTAYAITGAQKGSSPWTEVRLVNVSTGEQVQSIYESKQEVQVLNARTGKAIEKKETPQGTGETREVVRVRTHSPQTHSFGTPSTVATPAAREHKQTVERVVVGYRRSPSSDKPFATSSAACAYDKKHDRLYYTPMGINQLRYIDLKGKTPSINYFENEPFGALSNPHDVENQVTRMVFASDGNGYALTNNAAHLIRFTTGKKAEITDLGALTDDASNAVSVKHRGGYGGDMIADNRENLYLITANRHVFRIALETKVATYVGRIKGLPGDFSTNGAMVEEGTSVIVCSSSSTSGYYRFDIGTLQAEKVSGGSVFNASDLAGEALVTEKKKKKKEEVIDRVPEVVVENVVEVTPSRAAPTSLTNPAPASGTVTVYPNPVTSGVARLSFEGLPSGKYNVQLLDANGKLVSTQQVNIAAKSQVQELRLPKLIAKGEYLVQVVNSANRVSITNKIVVQ